MNTERTDTTATTTENKSSPTRRQPNGPPSAEAPIASEIEEYTPERIAEFLLNNAVSAEDYNWAREEARRLGVDPDSVPHQPPLGV